MSSLSAPRAQEDWPEVARPVPTGATSLVPLDAPLCPLARALFGAVLSLGKGLGADLPDVDPEGSYTGAEALDISHEVLGTLFPALRG